MNIGSHAADVAKLCSCRDFVQSYAYIFLSQNSSDRSFKATCTCTTQLTIFQFSERIVAKMSQRILEFTSYFMCNGKLRPVVCLFVSYLFRVGHSTDMCSLLQENLLGGKKLSGPVRITSSCMASIFNR